MEKPKLLAPRPHGYIDYLVVLAFVLAPSLFDFSDPAATTCYIVAGAHLMLSLLTAYPLGVIKAIPFPVHGMLELLIAPLLILLPWLVGFSGDEAARNWFVALGIAVFLVWLTTDYRAFPTIGRTTGHTGTGTPIMR